MIIVSSGIINPIISDVMSPSTINSFMHNLKIESVLSMLKRIGDIILIQLSSSDSNIYLIGDTAIDSGTGFNFTRLRDILRILKRDLKDFRQVILTHAHFDHIGGHGFFLEAKASVHMDDAGVLERGDSEAAIADFFDGSLKARKPDILLKGGEKIKAGNMELEVIHTPGHTPGSICLYDAKSATLFSGDIIFANSVGRTDTPGGDANAFAASMEKLRKLKIERLLPGHGDPVLSGAKKVLEAKLEETEYM
ncbi:MAG: MBL fold metallo-hydrolase [Candidatus Aenigmarchaeota archaeon]|nr:MBL fold metallo-hydrolase [Candidatus Aenigmarchaeota archaeon]